MMQYIYNNFSQVAWSLFILDSAIWTMAGPAIFRLIFSRAASEWATQDQSEKQYEFTQHRFLAYYAMHLLSLIVGWILLILRYIPDAITLIALLHSHVVASYRTIFFGAADFVLFITFLIVFLGSWERYASFGTLDVLNLYYAHNKPKDGDRGQRKLLGPKKAPPCAMNWWRLALTIAAACLAILYPLIPG
jgi:hypothetical protein